MCIYTYESPTILLLLIYTRNYPYSGLVLHFNIFINIRVVYTARAAVLNMQCWHLFAFLEASPFAPLVCSEIYFEIITRYVQLTFSNVLCIVIGSIPEMPFK